MISRAPAKRLERARLANSIFHPSRLSEMSAEATSAAFDGAVSAMEYALKQGISADMFPSDRPRLPRRTKLLRRGEFIVAAAA